MSPQSNNNLIIETGSDETLEALLMSALELTISDEDEGMFDTKTSTMTSISDFCRSDPETETEGGGLCKSEPEKQGKLCALGHCNSTNMTAVANHVTQRNNQKRRANRRVHREKAKPLSIKVIQQAGTASEFSIANENEGTFLAEDSWPSTMIGTSGFCQSEPEEQGERYTLGHSTLPDMISAANRSTQRNKNKRRVKRREARETTRALNTKIIRETAMASALATDYSLESVGVSKDLLTVKPFKLDGTEGYPRTLEELTACGYRIVEWDGRYYSPAPTPHCRPHRECRKPQTITDPKGMAYIYLAGRPLSESYTTVIEGATAAVEHATEQMSFRSHQKESRRGKFRATDSGVSSGTGNVVRPWPYHLHPVWV
jgi:hypothetical protein